MTTGGGVLAAIQASSYKNIIVTHGTFTIRQTALYLDKYLSTQTDDRKIILTGAMVPIAGFAVSDAGFNLGYSIASFGNIKPGVYICMNAGIFKPEEAEKNEDLLRFE